VGADGYLRTKQIKVLSQKKERNAAGEDIQSWNSTSVHRSRRVSPWAGTKECNRNGGGEAEGWRQGASRKNVNSTPGGRRLGSYTSNGGVRSFPSLLHRFLNCSPQDDRRARKRQKTVRGTQEAGIVEGLLKVTKNIKDANLLIVEALYCHLQKCEGNLGLRRRSRLKGRGETPSRSSSGT